MYNLRKTDRTVVLNTSPVRKRNNHYYTRCTAKTNGGLRCKRVVQKNDSFKVDERNVCYQHSYEYKIDKLEMEIMYLKDRLSLKEYLKCQDTECQDKPKTVVDPQNQMTKTDTFVLFMSLLYICFVLRIII
jgi:hypothetical protein